MTRSAANLRKIAISLPARLLAAIEMHRRATSETRSALIRRAIEKLLRDLEREGRVAEYVEGYGNRPETDEEVDAAEGAAADLLAGEDRE